MDMEDLRGRIEQHHEGSQRLYGADFLGRGWLAGWTANADVLVDELEQTKAERLQQRVDGWIRTLQDEHAAHRECYEDRERLRYALELSDRAWRGLMAGDTSDAWYALRDQAFAATEAALSSAQPAQEGQ